MIVCHNCHKKSDKNLNGCCSNKCYREYFDNVKNPTEIKLTIKDGRIFNPDELKLTIEDIKLWFNHRQQTAKTRVMKEVYRGLKYSLMLLPKEGVINFWSDAVSDFNDLLIKNALSHALGNDESWATTYKKIMLAKEKQIKKLTDENK